MPPRRAVGPVRAELPELRAAREELLDREVHAALLVVLAGGVQLEGAQREAVRRGEGDGAAEKGRVPLALLQGEGLEARHVEGVVELVPAEGPQIDVRERQPL